jgi:alpha-beta hydrolase superfamily lysophospholipase
MPVRNTVLARADAKDAAEDVMADLSSGAEDFAEKLQKYWDESEEKPTLVAVAFGGLLALYFTSNLVNAVDRLPLISNAFELIGIIFSGWTAYRYFLVDGEKEKLTADVKGFLSKVGVDL